MNSNTKRLRRKREPSDGLITVEDSHGIGWDVYVGTVWVEHRRMKPDAVNFARDIGAEVAGILNTPLVVTVFRQDGSVEKTFSYS